MGKHLFLPFISFVMIMLGACSNGETDTNGDASLAVDATDATINAVDVTIDAAVNDAITHDRTDEIPNEATSDGNQPEGSWDSGSCGSPSVVTSREALLEVAYAYFNRGAALQYDGEYFYQPYLEGHPEYNATRSNWRYRSNAYALAEMASASFNHYVVCSSFVYSVYKHALNIILPKYSYDMLDEAENEHEKNVSYIPLYATHDRSNAWQNYKSHLQVGDVIAFTGHVMLYIGDGRIAHATGKSYDFLNKKDKIETSGSITIESIDYITDRLNDKPELAVVRPLASDKYTPTLTEYVKKRLGFVENSCSLTHQYEGITINLTIADRMDDGYYKPITKLSVSPGEKVTYKISVTNNSRTNRTYNNIDVMAQILSCASFSSSTFSSTIPSLAPRQTLARTFTLTAKDSAECTELVLGGDNGSVTVANLKTNLVKLQIRNTLTVMQQTAVQNEARKHLNRPNTGAIPLIRQIYAKALGKQIPPEFNDQIDQTLFRTKTTDEPPWELINDPGPVRNMLVADLYGGRFVLKPSEQAYHLKTDYLVVGDVFFYISAADDKMHVYLYLGNREFLAFDDIITIIPVPETPDADGAVKNVLISGFAEKRFAVLRPSFVL